MSDDNKLLDQNANASLGAVGNRSPANIGVISPVGSPRKEEETTISGLSELKPAGVEIRHTIDQELSELGVQETQDRPDLTEEHRQAGIKYAGPSVPPLTEPSGLAHVPLTPEEMVGAAKTNPANSIRWLKELIEKTFNAMGLKKE